MKTLLAIALGVFAVSPDGDLEKAKTEFRKAIADLHAKTIADAADRLASTDQKAAVDALLDGYGTLATQIRNLWTDKLKWLHEKEGTGDFKIDTKTNPPTIPASEVKKFEAYLVAEKASREVEAKIMNLEAAKRGIVAALAHFKSDASVKEMLKELASGPTWQRRAGVAEALGQLSSPDIPPALAEAVKKDSEPQVKIAAMDALRDLKAGTPDVAPALLEALKSEFWQVKATAAQAVKALKIRDAAEALVDALGKAEGRLKMEFNEALVALTGVDKHGDPGAWKSWWDQNHEALAKGSYVPKPGEGANDGPRNATTFYGIPVFSKNVIFCLDKSGSMVEPSEWEIPPDVATGAPPPGGEIKREGNRKIDIARWQLKKALAMMPDGVEFNIIFFNHEWTILSKDMLKLSAATRKQAFDYIDRTEPIGQTNIYDPLEKAIGYSSTGTMAEKLAKSGVDTIFFMTDGLPNAGQVPLPADILVKVRELNKTKKVKINTVGVYNTLKGPLKAGEVDESIEGGKLLKALAEDSGGTYTCAGSAGSPQGMKDAPAGTKKKP